MPSKIPSIAVFLLAFTGLWTLAVFFVWRQNILPEELRFWFRTAFWISAAAIWAAYLPASTRLRRIGVRPVNLKIAGITVLSFAAVLGWNFVRTGLLAPPQNLLGIETLTSLAWGFVGVLVEELVFRGVIQTRLTEVLGGRAAIFLAALLFLAIHFPGWIMLGAWPSPSVVVSVFLIGVVCGMLRHVSGSLWPAVAAHWANNLGALL